MFASLRVSYTGLILIIGFLGGIIFNIFNQDDTFLTITTSSSDLLLAIFLPTLIFQSAYRIEYHAFMKSLYSIFLLSFIGYFISLFSICSLNKYLFFFQQWSFFQCLILGIILSTTRPITLIHQGDYGKTKRLKIILEGESMINNSLAIILFNSIKNFVIYDQSWHTINFFKTITISLVGGIGFGSLGGLLEIIGLPYFYDDPISEITITITIPYILYWLCDQLYCSGVVAIVVLGLILSNYKTAISSEAANFMEKFWDMLALIGNTIIYLLTALTLAELIKPNIRSSFKGKTILLEIGLAIINYLICYIVRFMIIIMLRLSNKFFRGYHLSWKECLLSTLAGFRGSVCLILALALASDFKYVNQSYFQYQILIYSTIVVFLSNSINSIYSFLLPILDLTRISQIKYLYMSQCIDSLRNLIEEKIRLLKKNKYLANSDWIFIEKYFQIKNPHKIIQKINNNHNHNLKCSNCHRLFPTIEFNQTEYEDLIEEARIRILNIQKTSFWKQYRDYEISTQAVRILSSLSDCAIDRKGQYISIDQLKYYYKPRTLDFIWKYLKSIFEKFHSWIRNDWNTYEKLPTNEFYCNILYHKRFYLFIIIIIIVNVTIAIIRSVIHISYKINLILTIIQSICVMIYLLEFIVKISISGIRMYFRSWIDYRIEFILLIFAIIECIFEYTYLIYFKSLSRKLRSSMQILMIIQIFRLIRFLEFITGNIIIVLERLSNRYITLSLELCKAYIISEDDVRSKLNPFIDIDQIRNDLYDDSIKRQNEIINELTCIQSEHPNVSASVKTTAAIQKLLNYSKNLIHHMTDKGLLGENEAHHLTKNINKHLHTELVPSTLFFPIPVNFFYIFPWLHDPDVLEYVLSHLHVKSYSLNEYIYKINTDPQGLYFLTAGYVEIINDDSWKYSGASSIEKSRKEEDKNSLNLCHQCQMNKQKIDLFYSSDDESEDFNNLLNQNQYRLLNSPGDIIGHIDLLNGQKHTHTCKCITNTLIWYLKSNDLIDLIKRFNHLKIFEKIWHYSSLQIAEIVLYKYFNTSPNKTTEQESIHIYGHLKHAFLIPESYLIEHDIIYSSHELILIQGQLQNIISSLIYTGPCFIQIEFGQCGLKILNINQTKILVLRSPHHHQIEEFNSSNDLPDLLKHVIYDEKLSILLPRINIKYEYIGKQSNSDELTSETNRKTLLGRFLEKLPIFQRLATP